MSSPSHAAQNAKLWDLRPRPKLEPEICQEYKGCRIFGFAVGEKPPYECAGRVEIQLSWGMIVEQFPASGSFNSEQEAADAGVVRGRLWINWRASEQLPKPKKD